MPDVNTTQHRDPAASPGSEAMSMLNKILLALNTSPNFMFQNTTSYKLAYEYDRFLARHPAADAVLEEHLEEAARLIDLGTAALNHRTRFRVDGTSSYEIAGQASRFLRRFRQTTPTLRPTSVSPSPA